MMARYFLHLREFGGGLVEDEEGIDFSNLSAARDYAVAAMRELVGEVIKHGEEPPYELVIVADENGSPLAAVPLIAPLSALLIDLAKDPAKIVPPARIEEYRRNADSCRGMAEKTDDPEDKTSWLKLAEAWLHMLPPREAASAEMPGWPKATEEDSKAAH
jgi:hypothetical protein